MARRGHKGEGRVGGGTWGRGRGRSCQPTHTGVNTHILTHTHAWVDIYFKLLFARLNPSFVPDRLIVKLL